MTKEEIMKARVEKNLKVLKLLKDNDANINAEEKRAILNEYTGWGGMREAIYTPWKCNIHGVYAAFRTTSFHLCFQSLLCIAALNCNTGLRPSRDHLICC